MAVGRISTICSVLLLPAFIFLLLPSISTPLIKGIYMSTDKGYTFGAWGYCLNTRCTHTGVGYEPAVGNGDQANGSFSLPINVRKGLSYAMPVHLLATVLTLISLVLAILSHYSRHWNSARFWLALFLACFFAFTITVIMLVVDILSFTPNLSWPVWLILVAAILLFVNCVLAFFRRRAILTRLDHQRRVDANPEMNGENLAEKRKAEEAGMRPLNDDSLPKFATFSTPGERAQNGAAGQAAFSSQTNTYNNTPGSSTYNPTPPRRPSNGPYGQSYGPNSRQNSFPNPYGAGQPPSRRQSPGAPLRDAYGYPSRSPHRSPYGPPQSTYPPMPGSRFSPPQSRGPGQGGYIPDRSPSSGPHTNRRPVNANSAMTMPPAPRRPPQQQGFTMPPAGTVPVGAVAIPPAGMMPVRRPSAPGPQDPGYGEQFERVSRQKSNSRPAPDGVMRDEFGNPVAALSSSPPDVKAGGIAGVGVQQPVELPGPGSRARYMEDVERRFATPSPPIGMGGRF